MKKDTKNNEITIQNLNMDNFQNQFALHSLFTQESDSKKDKKFNLKDIKEMTYIKLKNAKDLFFDKYNIEYIETNLVSLIFMYHPENIEKTKKTKVLYFDKIKKEYFSSQDIGTEISKAEIKEENIFKGLKQEIARIKNESPSLLLESKIEEKLLKDLISEKGG
jgi:hypothetical protein